MNRSDYKYCPRCRGRLMSSPDAFECPACGMVIYRNSAPTASLLIVRGDQVLLAKRGIEPRKGEYDVVGGFLKYGEDPVKGVIRETREETGLTVKLLHFLGVYMEPMARAESER